MKNYPTQKKSLSPRARHRIHLHLCPRVVRLLNFQMRLLCKRHFVFIIPFRGRQINVELTAGGGGKSERRKEKIKAKNADLDKERRKIFEKYVKPEAEAHKRKQSERSEQAPDQSKPDRTTRPAKQPKFASGANAVRLG